MKLPFTDTFIILIDTILSSEYDNPIPRKDYLLFFEIFEKHISRKINDDFMSMEINIYSERLKWHRIKHNGKILWKLPEILKTLQDKRVIDSTGYLAKIPNKQSHAKRYYYTEAFLKELDYSSFSIIYEEVNDKIYQTLKHTKEYDENDPQYKLLKSDRFTIDVDKCNNWLIESYKANLITRESCLFNIRRVFDIYNKDIYVVKINNGRVYTSFNSLKKELRQFCTIDNKNLLYCDLKCSQPYLLANYLLNKYPSNSDIVKFYDIVTTDDIYSWLMNKNNELYEEKLMDRNRDCKPAFYRYVFKKTNKGYNNIQRIIKDSFPKMYDEMLKEKREFAEQGSSLANFLQSAEASLFIPVCEMNVESGCLSVHDSLYFSPELVSKVKSDLDLSFSNNKLFKYIINYYSIMLYTA